MTLIGTDGGYYGFRMLVHGWGMAGLVPVGVAAIATAFGVTSFVRRDIS